MMNSVVESKGNNSTEPMDFETRTASSKADTRLLVLHSKFQPVEAGGVDSHVLPAATTFTCTRLQLQSRLG